MRARFVAAGAAVLFAAALARPEAGAEPLDLKRYMPVAEVQAGMTGIGKTTLEGTDIVEFQVRVLAVLKNSGPKRDLIVVRCSGAGLEESGIIAGMSGSPVYIGGRLIGAVAFAFQWGKLPLAGVQPIEQMLEVSDANSWATRGSSRAVGEPCEAGAVRGAGMLREAGAVRGAGMLREAGAAREVGAARVAGAAPLESGISDLKFKITDTTLETSDAGIARRRRGGGTGRPAHSDASGGAGWPAQSGAGDGAVRPAPADGAFSVPVSALGLGDLPRPGRAGREAFDLQPIQTPVMSATGHETPWYVLVFLSGVILLAGLGAGTLVRLMPGPRLKVIACALLLAGAATAFLPSLREGIRFILSNP